MRLPNHHRSSSFDLQMTSMIDVVFLLLVFFLWTSSFDEPEFDLASALSLPPVGNSSSASEATPVLFDEIVVRITQAPSGESIIQFNGTELENLSALAARLRSIASVGAQPAVIVDPAPGITMETAIAVYDVARAAGFDRVLFTVKP